MSTPIVSTNVSVPPLDHILPAPVLPPSVTDHLPHPGKPVQPVHIPNPGQLNHPVPNQHANANANAPVEAPAATPDFVPTAVAPQRPVAFAFVPHAPTPLLARVLAVGAVAEPVVAPPEAPAMPITLSQHHRPPFSGDSVIEVIGNTVAQFPDIVWLLTAVLGFGLILLVERLDETPKFPNIFRKKTAVNQ